LYRRREGVWDKVLPLAGVFCFTLLVGVGCLREAVILVAISEGTAIGLIGIESLIFEEESARSIDVFDRISKDEAK